MNWALLGTRMRKLTAIASDAYYRQAFRRVRVAPAIEHRAVLRRMDPDLVVDVGSNRGQFSLLCRRLWPSARLVAFEPLLEPAAVYRRLFADDAAVTLHKVALASKRGEMVMNISQRDDSSSLLPISTAQTDNYPGTGAVGVRTVPVAPLGDFLTPGTFGRRNLLKIDVQGFELEVLKSGEDILSHFDWIYAECSFVSLYDGQALAEEVTQWLSERGFALSGRYNLAFGKSGFLLQADLLFSRR